MDIDLLYPGAYPMARVALDAGETITTESGAMVSMTPGLEITSNMKGGLFKALGRKLLAGESFFQSTVTAHEAGEITLAPSSPGDMVVLDAEDNWWLEKGAFVGAKGGIEISTKGQGLKKGFLGGEGFFVLRAEGTGPLIASCYGALHELVLEAGQEHIVDNGHLVAWNCEYKIEKATKGWISSMTSGEGFVCRFTGPGTVYMQTRNLGSFASALIPFLPKPSSS